MTTPRLLRIGTRGSRLALAQATEAKNALEKAHPGLHCELTIIKTSGDDFTSWKTEKGASPVRNPIRPKVGPLISNGARSTRPLKGLFVKEIEEALLEGRIELAVHSVKDLQAELPKGIRLAAILPRQDPRDALVTRDGATYKTLPPGSSVGASSLRRQAQLRRLRRDLELVPIRGNVDTRLRKLDSRECGALVLAACGLIRLGLQDRISDYFDPLQMIPAPGQGALGIEVREDREETLRFVEAVDHPDSNWEIKAERALLKALGGGCQMPMGALARAKEGKLTLTGAVLSPDGLRIIRKELSGSSREAQRLGAELASHLRAGGADRLLFGQWQRRQA